MLKCKLVLLVLLDLSADKVDNNNIPFSILKNMFGLSGKISNKPPESVCSWYLIWCSVIVIWCSTGFKILESLHSNKAIYIICLPWHTALYMNCLHWHTALYSTCLPWHTALYIICLPWQTALYIICLPWHGALYITYLPWHTDWYIIWSWQWVKFLFFLGEFKTL